MRSRPNVNSAMLVMVFAGGSTALGQSKIYLAEYKYNDPKLSRMDLNGANVEELSIIPTADWLTVGLQVDQVNGKVYWTHGGFNAGRIRRANLDGTNVETIVSGLTNPRGLALDVDGEKVYWSDTQDEKMYRANLDGSGMEAIVDIGYQLGNPTLDLVNSKLYFGKFDAGGSGDIRRADLDGFNSEVLLVGLYTPIAVALDLGSQKIYWADSNTSFVSNHIARANLDGTEVEILYEGQPTSSGFTGIALDLSAGRLYWSDEITDVERGVWWANLDGSDAERIYSSPTGWNAGALTLMLEASPAIPTVSQWGLVVMSLILLAVGTIVCRKRGVRLR